ncbi:multidrug resistance-associated protein 1-like [Oppia nitens]|uniref:multidrug resistance-associated protein 1-like n=1 Tax=Oppia nitens TaxID=1686743 RepID=UPI0023DA2E0E|nr:multidrug resistance-associated protein 1-like [Oppia nitens]
MNTVSGILNAYYIQAIKCLAMKITSSVMSAVYRKSLVLSNGAKHQTSYGDITNLMAVDCQRVNDYFQWLAYVLVIPLLIVMTTGLLYTEFNYTSFAGLAVVVVIFSVQYYVMKIGVKIDSQELIYADNRLNITNEILNGIKIIKLYAWELPFMSIVSKLRDQELLKAKHLYYVFAVLYVMSYMCPMICHLVIFSLYLGLKFAEQLTAEKIFFSISLMSVFKEILSKLSYVYNTVGIMYVTFKRFNDFLNLDEHNNYVSNNNDSNDNNNMIDINGATLSWDTPINDDTISTDIKDHTLNQIDLHIREGMFVAIVGDVGSGKSSLLSAIIGDMELIDGSVNVRPGIQTAYVSQQAWIQNATIKQNIMFGKPFDEELYGRVIDSCALRPDIRQLAGGDQTEIGEKGVNLSGGQKQRVSLGRAVYSGADLYLLDDPLSAVDSHVGKHLMTEVLDSKTGILGSKTRLLVTNQLFMLPDVDLIVVLQMGRIVSVGTYRQLICESNYFQQLINQYFSSSSSSSDGFTVDDSEQGGTGSLKTTTKLLVNNNVNKVNITADTDDDVIVVDDNIVSNNNNNNNENDHAQLIDEEGAQSGHIDIKLFIKYVRSINKMFLMICLPVLTLSTGINYGINFWLAYWSKNITTNTTTTNNNNTITNNNSPLYYMIIFTIMILGQLILQTAYRYFYAISIIRTSKRLHRQLLARVMHAPMEFFDTTPVGRLLNRFNKDMYLIDIHLPVMFSQALDFFLQVIGIVVSISILTPMFLIPLGVSVIVYYFLQYIYINALCQLRRLESISRSPIYSHLGETLNGVSSIRAYDCRDRFIQESDNRIDQNLKCLYPYIIANSWLLIRLQVLSNLLVLFAALFGVIGKDSLTGADIGLILANAITLTGILEYFIDAFAQTQGYLISFERIDEYCSLKTEADWQSGQQLSDKWPEKGCVRFDGYGTRYRQGLDLVIKGIDIDIKSGEKIGIVGRTGAGKSSLTLALFRLIEPAMGRIVIDGIDISQLGLHELRSRLTIIPQEPVLFSGTIRSNLDPFDKFSDDQLWLVLDQSHLKEFVLSTDTGLDHPVTESGDNMSVGQRQLICLARALLRHTSILILDEATAAVDVETDSLIQQTIRQEFKSCTVLTIAHRINTILDYNRVLVLSDGRVAEFDSPDQLLDDRTTIFYSLAKDAGVIK